MKQPGQPAGLKQKEMAKRGDMVRFLNTTGGGKVTRVEGKLLYVEEDGFETPVLASEVVVVLPAGHEEAAKGAKLMFDQKAFNTGREEAAAQIQQPSPIVEEKPLPVEETSHGEKINITLAFEPADIKHLSTTRFNAVLVNDSNYFLSFIFLRRSEEERGWSVVYEGKVAPNELIDLASYTHDTLTKIERVAIQAVAYKCDKEFSLKSPIGVSRRLDLTKFHKLHCFRPGVYFDNPVLELPMVKDDFAVKALEHPAEAVEAYSRKEPTLKDLAKKYEKPDRKKRERNESPTKLLPLIEVDLHIAELTDTTAGMEPKDMLEMQLDEVRKVMKENCRRIGQKIVFIHGKGEGVLRKEVLSLLKKEYPKAELQDASFREYGFGATLVTVH